MTRPWLVVARKEYAEHVRNYWILTTSAVFLALMLVASGVVGVVLSLGAELALVSILDTVTTMRLVAALVVPVLALMLGYAALAGEKESGSLALLVAQPLTRAQVLMGKFAGLWAVLSSALILGVGLGGLVVVGNTQEGASGLRVLVVFVLETMLWGASWMAITLLVSALFDRRSTAMAGALFAWFTFSVIWVPVTVLVIALAGAPGAATASGGGSQWLLALELLNPNSVYGGLVSRSLDVYPGVIGAVVQRVVPLKATGFTYAVALFAWITLPLVAAYVRFRGRDI